MKKFDAGAILGLLLIVGGLLLLLHNYGVLGWAFDLLWAFLFGAAGLVFLFVFVANRALWWALIPACALLGVGALIALDQIAPRAGEAVGGALFLGGIGLGFWVVYFLDRERWWAVIPGGVMITLAFIAGLSAVLEGVESGGILFLGLGLTFGLLSLVNTPQGRLRWALIPAAVMLVMGLALSAATARLLGYLWPAALILVGLYFIFRQLVSL
jgi:hypothetical protein